MLSSALALLIAAQESTVPIKSPAQAIEAIAQGENVDAAFARLAAQGKPGLWALHDAAKKKSGVERGRLFEAIGRFATPEAEWALIVELKGTDSEGRAGAVRGLVRIKNPKTFSSIARQAESTDEVVRGAVVDGFSALGHSADGSIAALLESKSVVAREVGLRVLVKSGDGPELQEAMIAALKDPEPAIQYQGLLLVQMKKDQSQVYPVAELARSGRDDVACLAVQVIAELGGLTAAGELSSIVADPVTSRGAWMRAARLLRASGDDGFAMMLDAIARTKDDARRSTIAAMAVENVKPAELARAVDLLDDPGPQRAAAGKLILIASGEAGAEVARARIPTALPEMKEAIDRYLAERTSAPKDLAAQLEPDSTPDLGPRQNR
jgi:hypothetical protein